MAILSLFNHSSIEGYLGHSTVNTFVHLFWCKGILISVGVEGHGHGIGVCLGLEILPKKFSKWLYQYALPLAGSENRGGSASLSAPGVTPFMQLSPFC